MAARLAGRSGPTGCSFSGTSNTSSRTNRRARSGWCPMRWRARASFRWEPVVLSPPGCVVATIPGHQNCGMGTANQANFLRVKPYLDLFPLGPNQPGNVPAVGEVPGYESATFGDPLDQGNGTAQILVNATSPGSEYFTVGRFDWNISNEDNLFARYLFDDAYTTEPFYGNYSGVAGTGRLAQPVFHPRREESLLGHARQFDPVRLHQDFFQHPQQQPETHHDAGRPARGFVELVRGHLYAGWRARDGRDARARLRHQRDRPRADLAHPKGAGPPQHHRRPVLD